MVAHIKPSSQATLIASVYTTSMWFEVDHVLLDSVTMAGDDDTQLKFDI
jgi:D-lyxose ketol-isomerase